MTLNNKRLRLFRAFKHRLSSSHLNTLSYAVFVSLSSASFYRLVCDSKRKLSILVVVCFRGCISSCLTLFA